MAYIRTNSTKRAHEPRTQKLNTSTHMPPAVADAIAIIGLGYVGLPLALAAEKRGYTVYGIDTDADKIQHLKKHEAPPYLTPEEKDRLEDSVLTVSTDPSTIRHAGTVIICVPTPVSDSHEPNLEPIKRASESLGRTLRPGTLIVMESTVNPGICDEIVIPILEHASGLTAEKDFFFAHCPERINPGDTKWTVENIPRVIGANSHESRRRAVELYESILDAKVWPMQSVKEAEAVKIVENTFRDINIAFVNELAMSFDALDIDVVNVIQGASTKPFGFLAHFPGCGVGGHCIPVDPYYLISYAKAHGFDHRFLSLAREINTSMPSHTVHLLERELAHLKRPMTGSTIALLGLSYKADVPDLRESPALVIRDLLEAHGAHVQSYDPHLSEESNVQTLQEALNGADAALVATAHQDFRSLTPRDLQEHDIPLVIDGRNCLDMEAFAGSGITYRGIGRR